MTKTEALNFLNAFKNVMEKHDINIAATILSCIACVENIDIPEITFDKDNKTLFVDTDLDLNEVKRVEIKGKDNLGIEFYTKDNN